MTPRDICMLAQECLSLALVGLAGWFWLAWQRSASDARRLKGWGEWLGAHMRHAQDRAIEAESRLLIGQIKRSAATAKGNRTRAAKRNAVKAAKTAELRRGL